VREAATRLDVVGADLVEIIPSVLGSATSRRWRAIGSFASS
jgi:hypothetical protein